MTKAVRDPRIERTEAAVLSAVQQLLRTEGPVAVTFGRVSRESGVSRTTLYRHWAGPSDLVAAAWERLVPPNAVAHTGHLRGDLVAIFLDVRDAVESTAMRRSLPSLLAVAQDDAVIARLHADFVRERRQPIVDRLAEAARTGEVASDVDVEMLVDLLSGPLFYRELLRRERTTDRQVANLVDAVLSIARPDE